MTTTLKDLLDNYKQMDAQVVLETVKKCLPKKAVGGAAMLLMYYWSRDVEIFTILNKFNTEVLGSIFDTGTADDTNYARMKMQGDFKNDTIQFYREFEELCKTTKLQSLDVLELLRTLAVHITTPPYLRKRNSIRRPDVRLIIFPTRQTDKEKLREDMKFLEDFKPVNGQNVRVWAQIMFHRDKPSSSSLPQTLSIVPQQYSFESNVKEVPAIFKKLHNYFDPPPKPTPNFFPHGQQSPFQQGSSKVVHLNFESIAERWSAMRRIQQQLTALSLADTNQKAMLSILNEENQQPTVQPLPIQPPTEEQGVPFPPLPLVLPQVNQSDYDLISQQFADMSMNFK